MKTRQPAIVIAFAVSVLFDSTITKFHVNIRRASPACSPRRWFPEEHAGPKLARITATQKETK
jgi:hypothetical protein